MYKGNAQLDSAVLATAGVVIRGNTGGRAPDNNNYSAGGPGNGAEGGRGYPSDISGSPVTYGNGGKGGGTDAPGAAGAANTGNGGGAPYLSSGERSGGSGIVIVRWPYVAP